MSNQYVNSKKIVLPTTKWVELYTRLSEYVLEYSSLDPIYNDDGTKTEEKQDEFCNIVDYVENILRMYFIKEDEIKNNEEEELITKKELKEENNNDVRYRYATIKCRVF